MVRLDELVIRRKDRQATKDPLVDMEEQYMRELRLERQKKALAEMRAQRIVAEREEEEAEQEKKAMKRKSLVPTITGEMAGTDPALQQALRSSINPQDSFIPGAF